MVAAALESEQRDYAGEGIRGVVRADATLWGLIMWQDARGWTPLHYAAARGNADICGVLLLAHPQELVELSHQVLGPEQVGEFRLQLSLS